MTYTYELTSSTMIKRLPDNAFIPPDPANRDYAEYQAWLAEGNTPTPYVAPPVETPRTRTPEQKLHDAGLSVEELKSLLGLA